MCRIAVGDPGELGVEAMDRYKHLHDRNATLSDLRCGKCVHPGLNLFSVSLLLL